MNTENPLFVVKHTEGLESSMQKAEITALDTGADLGDVRFHLGNAEFHAEALGAELIPYQVEAIMEQARSNGLRERPRYNTPTNSEIPLPPMSSDSQARNVVEGRAIVRGGQVNYLG